jgi:hypothetical protein
MLQGLALGWEKVAGNTLATVEDIDGVAIGLSLLAIAEQLMMSNPAIKMHDGCVTLRISELRKTSRFPSVQLPALEHNASVQKSVQSQLPGVNSRLLHKTLYFRSASLHIALWGHCCLVQSST